PERSTVDSQVLTAVLQTDARIFMAGNSRRQGAIRKPGTKKGQVVGSGGQRRKGLEGKGPTPKAEERPGHKAYRAANASAKRDQARQKKADKPELIAGRNPVVEALRADVPATALYVALNIDIDDRVNEAVRLAGDKGISILEIPREELDRKTNRAVHQGMGLQVPPFTYAHPDDLMAVAHDSGQTPLFVALDADGSVDVDSLELASEPLVIVLGSEGRGLSRLVRETCDATVSIPMAAGVESLNASVAAGVLLAEVARRRRIAGRV